MENSPIVNIATVAETGGVEGHFGAFDKILTPTMRARGGKLGVVQVRVPPKTTACPFHHHTLEDEVFYVLSGHGALRYGDAIYDLRAGDCVSCPAGTQIGHQVANTSDTDDLVYLAIGLHEPHEVCGYPDSGKVMVRSLRAVGTLTRTPYMQGEPEVPAVFAMAQARTPAAE